MNKLVAVLCAFFLFGCVLAQDYVTTNPGVNDRMSIDTFVSGADIQGLQLNEVGQAQFIWPGSEGGSSVGILGGERDLYLDVTSVPNNFGSVFTSIGTNGDFHYWDSNTPQGATGHAKLQWDGVDGDGLALGNGLGNLDLTDGGNNRYFHLQVSRDISVQYTLTLASSGGQCVFPFVTTGTDGSSLEFQDIWIDFARFTGGCSVSSIAAIQLRVEIREGVDPRVYLFSIAGNEPSQSSTPSIVPSPSNTPTPTTVPSQSRTPTPVPSQSRTPTPTPTQTRTPTPTPSPECICICPAFTCALIFDADDDVNNVYYFTGPGFTFPETPDDVDTNSLTISNPFTGNRSGASVLSVSIAAVAILFAMF